MQTSLEKLQMNKKISAMALAVAGAMLVVGCGGGGGSGGGTESPAAAPVKSSMTLSPSLGQFSTSCSVEALDAAGKVLDVVKVGADGKAILSFVDPKGPIVARVKGGEGCTYFDEAAGEAKAFPAGRVLSALLAEFRSEAGVHLLTHLAARDFLKSDGSLDAQRYDAQKVKEEADKIRLAFLGLSSDLFAPPELIGSADQKIGGTDWSSRLAIVLAALPGVLGDISNPDAAAESLLGKWEQTPAEINTAIRTAVLEYAVPAIQSALQSVIEEVRTPAQVEQLVAEFLHYENEIAQAKTIFRALREQVLAMSNESGTGSLDKQWDRMREETTHQLEILGAIDELEVLIKGASVMLGVYPGAGPVDTTQTVIWGYDGECVIAAGRASAECSVYRRDSGLLVNLTQAGPARVEWDLQREEFIGGGLTTFTGYTGTIDLTSATAKLSGRYAPMSGNAKATLVQADVTVSGDQETVKDYKLQGTGVLDSVDAQGASLFKTEISNLAFDMGGNAGQIVSPVLDLTLVASSPNFRFTGRIGATGVLESQTPGQDWIDYQPATATLSGKFENTQEQFTLFDGLFTLGQDWSNGYKPYEDESASNFAKLQGSFSGTLFEAKDKAGLTLNLQARREGWLGESLSFDFATGNGVALQGTAARTAGAPADPEWVWSLANSNGVKLSYSEYSKTGEVLAADGRQLGAIGRDMVSFVDGTSESLF